MERVKNLGQVVIKVYLVEVVSRVANSPNHYKQPVVSTDADSVPEKSHKGKALSRRTE